MVAASLPLIAACVALSAATGAPTPAAGAILGPGQERLIERVLRPTDELPGGWRVEGSRVEPARVIIRLTRGGATDGVEISLVGAATPGAVRSEQGWLLAPDGAVPEAVIAAIVTRLDAATARLAWRAPTGGDQQPRPPPVVDEEKARQARARLQVRLDRRFGRAVDADGSSAASHDGAPISRRVAAGGPAPEDIQAALERQPDEPRLMALVARRARLDGDLEAAARWTAAALALPVADELVLREAQALGWGVVDTVPGALAAPDEEQAAPTWPWWAAVLGLACFALVAAWTSRDLVLPVALAVGALAAIALVPQPGRHAMPELPDALVLPLAGGPCETLPTRVEPSGALAVAVRCADRWERLSITPGVAGEDAAAHTTAHQIGIHARGAPSPALRDAAHLVAAAVEEAEAGGFVAARGEGSAVERGDWPAWSDADAATRLQLRVGAGVTLAALLAALALLVARARATVLDESVSRWGIAAFCVAAVAHAVAPSAMIMVYGGYDLTAHLVDGRVPRYGVGSVWLYGLPMWLFGHDHGWIQGLNRVFGFLACLAAWDLGRELWDREGERGRLASIVAAWLLALLPVIWRAHTSESILVAPTLLLLVGLRHWARRPGSAALLLAAAGLCRPELAMVAALVPLWSWASTRERPPVPATLAVWSLSAVSLWSAARVAAELSGSAALPGISSPIMGIRSAIEGTGILSNPDMTPLGAWLFLGAGLLIRPRPSAGLPTLVVAVLWLGATGLDLVAVSVPRLHTPILLWLLPLIARGAVELGALAWSSGSAARAVSVAAALAVCVSGGWNGYHLFRPTNEDAEELLWRQAVAALPDDRPGCLVTLGYSDPPQAGKSPRFHPGYLLDARHGDWELFDLSQLDDATRRCPSETWVLQSVRCYVDLRQDPPRPAPPAGSRLAACEAIEKTTALQTEFEREVPNRGDLAFPMYPDGGTLRVGLYRVGAAGKQM